VICHASHGANYELLCQILDTWSLTTGDFLRTLTCCFRDLPLSISRNFTENRFIWRWNRNNVFPLLSIKDFQHELIDTDQHRGTIGLLVCAEKEKHNGEK
jgi:hypothetical protein